jgi:hypothetical protein
MSAASAGAPSPTISHSAPAPGRSAEVRRSRAGSSTTESASSGSARRAARRPPSAAASPASAAQIRIVPPITLARRGWICAMRSSRESSAAASREPSERIGSPLIAPGRESPKRVRIVGARSVTST